MKLPCLLLAVGVASAEPDCHKVSALFGDTLSSGLRLSDLSKVQSNLDSTQVSEITQCVATNGRLAGLQFGTSSLQLEAHGDTQTTQCTTDLLQGSVGEMKVFYREAVGIVGMYTRTDGGQVLEFGNTQTSISKEFRFGSEVL